MLFTFCLLFFCSGRRKECEGWIVSLGICPAIWSGAKILRTFLVIHGRSQFTRLESSNHKLTLDLSGPILVQQFIVSEIVSFCWYRYVCVCIVDWNAKEERWGRERSRMPWGPSVPPSTSPQIICNMTGCLNQTLLLLCTSKVSIPLFQVFVDLACMMVDVTRRCALID